MEATEGSGAPPGFTEVGTVDWDNSGVTLQGSQHAFTNSTRHKWGSFTFAAQSGPTEIHSKMINDAK